MEPAVFPATAARRKDPTAVIKRFTVLVLLALAAFAASNVLAVSVHPHVEHWATAAGAKAYWFNILGMAGTALSEIGLPWLALWPLALLVQRAVGSPAFGSGRFVLVHLGVCATFSLAQILVHVAFEPDTWGLYHFDIPYRTVRGLLYYLAYNGVFYVGVVASHQAAESRQRLQETALNEARLEASLARAQLDSLRGRIHPHFIFNTLQSINVLVLDRQAERASEMIEKLSVLLRQAIDGDDRQLVTVEEETASVREYLDIEAIRFGGRVRIEWQVEPGTARALVPSLILQPLIENGIKHGVALTPGPGTIAVSVRRMEARLEIAVRNDGPPLPRGWRLEDQTGFGLRATASRLALLYQGQASFEVRDAEGGGVETRAVIPYQEEVAAGSRARV